MAGRKRDPRRDEALEIYLQNSGEIKNKDIAEALDLKPSTISGWKNIDKWGEKLEKKLESDKRNKGNKKSEKKDAPKVSKQPKQPKKKQGRPGAPKGNQNAKGHGPPKGTQNSLKHGFYAKIMPNDPDTLSIIDDITLKDPVDIVWDNIVLNFTAIARAQKIMFVKDQDDITKELKRTKEADSKSGSSYEEEYEIQFAGDKQALFMKAQATAMSELRSHIKLFMELSGQDDKRRLELEKMQQAIRINDEKLEMEKQKFDSGEDNVTEIVAKRWSE